VTKETMNNGHPEGNIYEQFAYLYNSVGYPNSSDITELSEMPDAPRLGIEGVNNGIRISKPK